MAKTITVFGSSKPVEGEKQYRLAYELGKLLGQKGFNVCTGGYFGIMEAVSKGAVESGSEALGITVSEWGRAANKYVTKEISCSSVFKRLETLIENGDAFIILQGGTGTLLELAAVWEFSNRRMMDHKPVACHSGLWKDVVTAVNKQMEYEGRETDLIKTFDTIVEIVNYVVNALGE